MTLLAPAQTRYSPQDVLRLEEEGLFELVSGQLKEKTMGSLATSTAVIISSRLFMHLESSSAGVVYSEQSFQCFANDPQRIRRPDLAFIAASRLADVEEEGHVTIAPDLVVEIVSPSETVYDLEEKLDDYRSAGVPMIWVVFPKHRRLHLYVPGQAVQELREEDTVAGGAVLPGFSAKLKDLLPRR